MNGLVLLLALSTPSVDYGWRIAPDGEVECIIQIEPSLFRDLQTGEAARTVVRDILPKTGRPTRFIIQVGDQELPRDAKSAADLIRQIDAEDSLGVSPTPAPRFLQLSHADPEGEVPAWGRTVFETQLQLRRGSADTHFNLDSQNDEPRVYAANGDAQPPWNPRTNSTARDGVSGPLLTITDSQPASRFADASNRYGTNTGATGSRYAADASTQPGNDLQIRYNESGLGGGRYGDSSTASDDSRYAAPLAPPLSSPSYTEPAPPTAPRTPLASTTREPTNYATRPLTADRYAASPSRESVDPRYEDPRYEDPRYEDPRYEDPRYDARRYEDPRASDPRTADTRFAERISDPRLSVPRLANRDTYAGPFDATASAADAAKPASASFPGREALEAKIEALEAEKEAAKKQPEPQWGPLVMALFALMASVSGNAYLGHVAYGLYRRYRSLTDDMRATPDFGSSVYDDESSRSTGSSSRGRRRRRGLLASRY